MSASGSLAGPLRSLMLMTMAREHEDILARAEAENWGYRRFLAYLVENEVNERLRRRIERQLKESGLPPGKTRGSRGFACICELDRAASPVACVKRLALALLVAAQITASAILDRLLHRAQTVVIEGKSYRMKDRLSDEAPA